jgi:RNA polymerase sigma-70 factor (ECF subfamily)
VDADAALLKRAQKGDEQAFARLIEPEQHRLYTLAVRELGSAADAEDAVQEALVRAWRALPRFRGEARFSTWLYRIQLNAIHDQRNKRARGSGTPLEDVPEPADPRDALHASELGSALQDALNALDETYRTAVLMSDVSGMSYGEIAAVLGIAEGTVKSRIFRGRAELARLLGTSTDASESNQ